MTIVVVCCIYSNQSYGLLEYHNFILSSSGLTQHLPITSKDKTGIKMGLGQSGGLNYRCCMELAAMSYRSINSLVDPNKFL